MVANPTPIFQHNKQSLTMCTILPLPKKTNLSMIMFQILHHLNIHSPSSLNILNTQTNTHHLTHYPNQTKPNQSTTKTNKHTN